jgi:hypothetical protein
MLSLLTHSKAMELAGLTRTAVLYVCFSVLKVTQSFKEGSVRVLD